VSHRHHPAPPTRTPRRPRARRRHLVVLGSALALLAGACAPDADPVDDVDPTDDPGDEAADEAAPEEPREVTLLTHDSFDVSEDVLAAFTDDTGIEVSVVPLGDAGSALNQAILTRDAPQGDLLFGVDTTFLSRALDAGPVRALRQSPLLDDVDERFLLDPRAPRHPDRLGDVCLNHDVAWFEDADLAVPSDLADLTDPAYEGLLAVQNPATSSPGLAFLLATIERFGEDGYLDFWEDLVDNDVVVTDGWSEAYYDEFSATGGGTGRWSSPTPPAPRPRCSSPTRSPTRPRPG
jgi:thiamine transport system substrate-binding protein